jgi:hypothetical protein
MDNFSLTNVAAVNNVHVKHSFPTMKKRLQFPLFSACLLASVASGLSQVVTYDTAGSTYTQNFNTLVTSGSAAWTNGSTVNGWYFATTTGSAPPDVFASSGSSSQQGPPLSLGTGADRAFGAQSPNLGGSGTNALYYGVAIANSSGATLNAFSLSYTGEQWRVVQADGADTITLQYQIFDARTGSLTAASGWSNVSSLGFTSPRVGIPTGALDGNLAINQVAVAGDVVGLTWNDGQELWLRWGDHNIRPTNSDPEQRQMLGIDDLNFQAVPEPAASLLVGLGTAFVIFRIRRKAN